MQYRASACLFLESINRGLEHSPRLMQQFDDFARAELQLMQSVQVALEAADRQA